MLRITPVQLLILDADFRHRWRVRFLTSLRICGWMSGDMTDSTAYRRIDAALAFVTDHVRRRPDHARLLGSVLNDLDVEPRRRLDFVFRALKADRFGVDPLPFPPYRG